MTFASYLFVLATSNFILFAFCSFIAKGGSRFFAIGAAGMAFNWAVAQYNLMGGV